MFYQIINARAAPTSLKGMNDTFYVNGFHKLLGGYEGIYRPKQ